MSEISKEKTGHLLSKLEKKWKNYLVPKVPMWLGTKNLTFMSGLWSILVLIFGQLAQNDINWLWMISIVIVLEYITDTLDGAVGRYRNDGFVKWGYYMDKMFDWVFACSLLISYSFILSDQQDHKLLYVLGIYGAFVLHTQLLFTLSKRYKISFFTISPTELRVALITANTLLILFGRIYIEKALPYILGGTIVSVFIIIYQTQRVLHREDIHELNKVKKE